jgi:hypothetical protein
LTRPYPLGSGGEARRGEAEATAGHLGIGSAELDEDRVSVPPIGNQAGRAGTAEAILSFKSVAGWL